MPMPSLAKKGVWSLWHKKCVKCKTTDNPHRQKGLCTKCFYKERYQREKENFKKYFKLNYEQRKLNKLNNN